MLNELSVKQYYNLAQHTDISELQQELEQLPIPEELEGKKTPVSLDEQPLRIILELRQKTWEDDYNCCIQILSVWLGTECCIDELPITMCFPLCKWIVSEIERINKRESETIGHKATAEERAAGIENLKRLGDFMLIDNLAQRQGISHDEVLELPYLLCFMMQWKDKELADYKERLNKIISKKYERKNNNRRSGN